MAHFRGSLSSSRPSVAMKARVRLEALLLALLSAVPLLPYALLVARAPVERFALQGDYAGLELATWFVRTGRTLLGPYSRFGFNHPGPLYFYALAPFYEASGRSPLAIFSGALAIAAISSATTVLLLRIHASRAHALAAFVVQMAWFAAFGTMTLLPWNPLVVVLPLGTFLVASALVATGTLTALPVAVSFGAFVTQTHLSTVPTVLGAAGATLAFALVRAFRSRSLDRSRLRSLLAAAALLLLLFWPPIAEQTSASGGNLTKLARFFVHRKDPLAPLASAARNWAFGVTWLPDRVASRSLLVDELAQQPMGSIPVPESTEGATLVVVHLVALALALVVAHRRRDAPSTALLAVSVLAHVLAILALRAVVGTTFYYLVFWTTAASTLGWTGVLATALRTTETTKHGERFRRWFGNAALFFAIGACLLATGLQRASLEHVVLLPTPSNEIGRIHDAIVSRTRAEIRTPVIHAYGGWHAAMALVLELVKDGESPEIVARDRWILGRQLAVARGEGKPRLHLWVRTPFEAMELAPCLSKIAMAGQYELFAAEHDVVACPPSPPNEPAREGAN